MNAEMVKKLKQNTTAYGLLSVEMHSTMDEIGVMNFNEYRGNSWNRAAYFYGSLAYRLRPDYEPPKPEPKIVKCEVFPYFGFLKFHYNHSSFCVDDAPAFVNFSHFEYADGCKTAYDRRIFTYDKPAVYPKYVVMVETE